MDCNAFENLLSHYMECAHIRCPICQPQGDSRGPGSYPNIPEVYKQVIRTLSAARKEIKLRKQQMEQQRRKWALEEQQRLHRLQNQPLEAISRKGEQAADVMKGERDALYKAGVDVEQEVTCGHIAALEFVRAEPGGFSHSHINLCACPHRAAAWSVLRCDYVTVFYSPGQNTVDGDAGAAWSRSLARSAHWKRNNVVRARCAVLWRRILNRAIIS